MRALFATAFEEGVIRSNPTAGLRLAVPQADVDDEERAKALSPDELRALLAEIPAEWRLFFRFLACSGCRIGEAVALTWANVDADRRRVKIRRRWYRGAFAPPKSKYGRREIPLPPEMASALRELRAGRGDDELVFTSERGMMVDASNLMSRVLKPAAVRAGLGEWVVSCDPRTGRSRRTARTWVGFHTFRHTCATMLFRAGVNAKQAQAWLGHHSPAFTLATYVHLLPDDLPEPDFLDALTAPQGATRVATRAAETGRDERPALRAASGGDAGTSSRQGSARLGAVAFS